MDQTTTISTGVGWNFISFLPRVRDLEARHRERGIRIWRKGGGLSTSLPRVGEGETSPLPSEFEAGFQPSEG